MDYVLIRLAMIELGRTEPAPWARLVGWEIEDAEGRIVRIAKADEIGVYFASSEREATEPRDVLRMPSQWGEEAEWVAPSREAEAEMREIASRVPRLEDPQTVSDTVRDVVEREAEKNCRVRRQEELRRRLHECTEPYEAGRLNDLLDATAPFRLELGVDVAYVESLVRFRGFRDGVRWDWHGRRLVRISERLVRDLFADAVSTAPGKPASGAPQNPASAF